MKTLIVILKFIFVLPVTAAMISVMNWSEFKIIEWYISFDGFFRWLLAGITYFASTALAALIIGGLSWLFAVKKINAYIISFLVIINGGLWMYWLWNRNEIFQSLELVVPVGFMTFALCYIADAGAELAESK